MSPDVERAVLFRVRVPMICFFVFSMPIFQPFLLGGASARTVSPPMMTPALVIPVCLIVRMSWSAMYPFAIPPRSILSGLRRVTDCVVGLILRCL